MDENERIVTIGEGPECARHFDLCMELHNIFEKKNHDYGNSFHEIFKKEGYAAARVHLFEKLSRLETLTKDPGAVMLVDNESVRDTLLDLANYALLTVMEYDTMKEDLKIYGDDQNN